MSKRNILIISLALLALVLAACGTLQSAPAAPTVTPYEPAINLAEAQQIARQSACAQSGTLKDTGVYNPNSNTWWIDMAADKPDCNPACVVDVKTKTAEVNWRCTGAIPPVATQPPAAGIANPASENCVKQGGTMSIQQGLTGGEYGLCVFPDGKQCEEWAMQRGECPVGGIAVVGRYTAQQPAADAIGRVLELELLPDNTATLKTQFIGKGTPIIETGTWAQPDKTIVVTIESAAAGKTTLPFQYENNALILQGLGAEALTLKRTPSGNTHTAEFGGVKIAFDDQLAKTAQGENQAAIPVTDGPVMGGAAPAAIRFLFDGAQAEEYTDPGLTQVLIYKADEWANLDPAIAKEIADLKALLAAKPAVITDPIPVLPPIPAAQVFHAQTRYLDFQGGSGVGFVTHYAQDVSPVTAHSPFYTFQGLTDDGQYYVVVFSPITTALLPAEANLDGAAYDEFAKNYESYLTDLVAQLDGLLPAAYTPDLTLIDGLVKSIEIGAQPASGG